MKVILLKILPIFFLLAGPSSLLHASEPIPVDATLTIKKINRNIDYIEDTGKKLTIENIADNDSLRWARNTRSSINFGYSLNEQRVMYKISDEGFGFDYASMMDADPGDRNYMALPHGRGLILIKHAFDAIKFNKKENQILLVKYFKKTKKRHA